MKNVEKIIINTDEKEMEKVNWTNAWSKKYPVFIALSFSCIQVCASVFLGNVAVIVG